MKEDTVFTIKKIPVSIEEQMEHITGFFGTKKQYRFLELVADYREKIIIIVTFVAMLEMIRDNKIRVYSEGEFNDMIVYRIDAENEEEVVEQEITE